MSGWISAGWAGIAFLGIGCSPPDPILFTVDPALVFAADATSVTDFDGRPTTFQLRSGWSVPRSQGLGRPWEHFSNAIEKASLYFHAPFVDRVEFIGSCSPLASPAAIEQHVTPILNGHRLPRLRLAKGLHELRFELPGELLVPRINRLDLEITALARPTATPYQLRRTRMLACDAIAIAAGGTPLSQLLGPRAEFDPALSRFVLPSGPGSGLGVAVPIPPRRAATLHLGAVQAPDDGAHLSLSLRLAGGELQPLWDGEARDASDLFLSIPPRAGPVQLVIRNHHLPGASRVIVSVPDDFLTLEATEREPVPSGSDLPNIFVYVIDTLRADALGVYGSKRPSSPYIDRFAEDAVVFDAAWSAAPWTLPSTISLLTGVYPFRHGFTALTENPPVDSLPATLAQRLKRRGYRSFAVSQTWVVSERFGIDRGFDVFYLNDILGWGVQRTGPTRWFLWDHLAADPSTAPTFVYIHTVAAHHPYTPSGVYRRFAIRGSAEFDPRRQEKEPPRPRDLYDGEVLYEDRQFGAFVDLLRVLGLYEESLIVLTSDHGEEFREHDDIYHSRALFEELLRVPLIVKFPASHHAGRRVRRRVSTIDVAATILDRVGGDLGGGEIDGLSLADPDATLDRGIPVLAETRVEAKEDQYWAVDLSAAVVDHIKCIQSALPTDRFGRDVPAERGFDLTADPAERTPLDPDDPAARSCNRSLREWRDRLTTRRPESEADANGTGEIDEDTRRRLEALDYL